MAMSAARCFDAQDVAGKLKTLGFLDCRECPGWKYEMRIDDIEVSAVIMFDSVMMRATRITQREIGVYEVRVPMLASIQVYADAIAQIMRTFYPQIINRDAVWADFQMSMVRRQFPLVVVGRVLLRRELKNLKMRITQCPTPDARLDFHDNDHLAKGGILTVNVGNQSIQLPATGVWVGRIWVKARDLFNALKQRIPADPVGIALYNGDLDAGKWLIIGNRSMRASWEMPIEPSTVEASS